MTIISKVLKKKSWEEPVVKCFYIENQQITAIGEL